MGGGDQGAASAAEKRSLNRGAVDVSHSVSRTECSRKRLQRVQRHGELSFIVSFGYHWPLGKLFTC